MAIILPLHHHYSVYVLHSGGSAGSSQIRLLQWLRCQGPIFSPANVLRLAVTKQPSLCFIWPLLQLRHHIRSRSFLLGQEHRGKKNNLDIKQLFWNQNICLFFVFLENSWLSLGNPDVILCSSACRSKATLTGTLCDGARRLSSVIINQNLYDHSTFWRGVSRFHRSFYDKLPHRRTSAGGIELIRAPVTNGIFVCCFQVAEMPPKSRNLNEERRIGAHFIFT